MAYNYYSEKKGEKVSKGLPSHGLSWVRGSTSDNKADMNIPRKSSLR